MQTSGAIGPAAVNSSQQTLATGAASNGAGSNGAGSNGAGSNGAGSNGAAWNGAASNGAASNGAGSNGAASAQTQPIVTVTTFSPSDTTRPLPLTAALDRPPTAHRRGRHALLTPPAGFVAPVVAQERAAELAAGRITPGPLAPGRLAQSPPVAARQPFLASRAAVTGLAGAAASADMPTILMPAVSIEPTPEAPPLPGVDPHRRGSMLRGAILTAASTSVLPLTALATGPILARVLGPHDRGLMSAVLAPMFVAMFVAAFAVPEASTYAVAKLKVPPTRAFLAGAPLLLLSGLVATAILWVSAPTLMAGTPEAVGLLRTVLPCLPLMMFTLLQRFAMSGSGHYASVAAERTTAALGRAVLLVGFAVTGVLTAYSAIWINLASTIVAALVLTVPLVRSRTEHKGSDRLLPYKTLSAKMSVYALRGWGGVCANLVNWRLDQAIMPALIGATPLGYYAVAVSLAELPSTLIGATKSVIFTEASARDDLRLAARAARVVLLASLLVDGVLALTAPLLVRLLFGRAFEPSGPLAQVLLIGNIPFTAEVILASGLLAAGHPGLRSIGQVIAAVLTVTGIFVLVPTIGPAGAALTSVVAYTLSFAMTITFFCRSTGIPARDCVLIRGSDVSWLISTVRRRRRKATAQ